jgi:hypothetical protein
VQGKVSHGRCKASVLQDQSLFAAFSSVKAVLACFRLPSSVHPIALLCGGGWVDLGGGLGHLGARAVRALESSNPFPVAVTIGLQAVPPDWTIDASCRVEG